MKILKFLTKPLLIILILVATLWLIGFLNRPTPSKPLSYLALSPDEGTYSLGQTFAVDIILKTNQEINGADTVLSFDPDILEVIEIKPGSVFPAYPRKTIDLQKKQILITGVKIKKDGQVFTQQANFATIIFKAKNKGRTKVNFVFSKGKTTGSIIVKADLNSENILEKVYNGSYEIK